MRSVARMTTTGKDISSVLRAIVKTEREHLPTWVVDSFNQYIALEPETRNSAVFNVNMAMSLWNNGLISAATETSDFDIRELRRRPMTIFIGCTIAELAIFRPLIRILFQQIHDLMMVRIPGPDEPHQVLLMLDEFYHVGRMDSLISKITISAGYGFRMAIVMQDIAQLDELYGKNTRATTLSGSQIKLFIQVNDLETSEFVSEMLGETTQVYKTPVVRPGQGIFAPRGWAPHYTPRPLRSPLELREMSARVSILMVKNSRSFELTKIRHYRDKPYRKLFEAAKGSPPPLPTLREWQDEELGGAISATPVGPVFVEGSPPAPAVEREKVSEPSKRGRKASPSAPAKTPTATRSRKPTSDQAGAGPPLVVEKAKTAMTTTRKSLTLGAEPAAGRGESCNIRDVLAASERVQREEFAALTSASGGEAASSTVQAAVAVMSRLREDFGDDEASPR